MEKLNNFMKDEIVSGLYLLPEKNQQFFKRIYSHSDLNKSLEDIVDNLNEKQLKNALRLVEATLKDAEI